MKKDPSINWVGGRVLVSGLLGHDRVFVCFPDLQTSKILFLSRRGVVFGDKLSCSTRPGRAPANNSDVLAKFRLVYRGEVAAQPLMDDSL